MPVAPQIRKFAGDFRLWQREADGSLSAVIADAADFSGNQPIETSELSFSYEAGETTNIISTRRDDRYQQPIYSDTLPGVTSCTILLQEIPPIILARMLFGNNTGATVAAGAVVNATMVVPADRTLPIQLPYRHILLDPAMTITYLVEAVVTPLELGTHYLLDARRGQIRLLSAAPPAAGVTLTLNYSYAAHVSNTVAGGAVPTRQFVLTGDMQDKISLASGELRVPQVALTTTGEINWLSLTPITVTLAGEITFAAGESALYTFVDYKQTT